jgi:hypothetical protein
MGTVTTMRQQAAPRPRAASAQPEGARGLFATRARGGTTTVRGRARFAATTAARIWRGEAKGRPKGLKRSTNSATHGVEEEHESNDHRHGSEQRWGPHA